MEVDLGAVAKGFAAREAEAAIRDAGGTSAMLDLGGNVTVIGRQGGRLRLAGGGEGPPGTPAATCASSP